MDPRPRKAREVFLAAIKLPDQERERYLQEACGEDPVLRQRVNALLHAQAELGSFHDAPAGTIDQPITETSGMVFGPYRLLEQIGEGGMGTVWMAEQTEPVKRVVALKLIKAGMDSKQVIARFEAERQALALMDHVNIAKVLDAGTTSTGRPYFVMDLVKGVPITRYCDEHQLTPRQRLELFIPVCHAVQHAHQKGIIHRDLKPSNVLVALYDGKPVPKVIDFGVAKAAGQPLTDKSLATGFGHIVGTLEYMSPEQAETNNQDIDTRSDIYSLGVLLYELLTGSPPFSRKELEKAGMLEMLRVIREQEPSKPSTKLSTAEGLPTLAANRGTEPAKLTRLVRGELDWLVMKALEKDRSRRYETASGLAADLQRYLADEPVLACPPSAGYRLRKFVRRNKGSVLAAMVLLGMLIAMLGVAVVSNFLINDALVDRNEAYTKLEDEQAKTADALTKRTEALGAKTKALEELGKAQKETEAANATLKDALEREQQAAYQHRIALAHHEWLAGNPVRSLELLKECPEKYRHWEWHFLYRLHHTDLLTLQNGNFVDDVAYSPDGRLLASTGGVTRVWEVRTGRPLFTLKGHTKQVSRVVFSPDGTRLATSGYDGSVRVWDAATGKQVVAIKRSSASLPQGLAFGSDSRQVACADGDMNASAAKIWDAATGKELFSWPSPEPHRLNGVALSPDGKYLAASSEYSVWLIARETKKAVQLKVAGNGFGRLVFSRDSGRLAAAASSRQVRIWQVPTGHVLTTVHFSAELFGLAFSADGRHLAVAGSDHTVQVVNADDGQMIMTLRGHSSPVRAAVFSPSGRQIASGGFDGTIRFWDITAPQEGALYSGGQSIRRAAFSDDGQRLTVTGPLRLLTWDLTTGRNLFARAFNITLLVSALSRDGLYVAGSKGDNLALFEATTGKELYAQRGDSVTIDLSFSPDGRLLAEGAVDGSVRVRDAQTGRILQSLQGHQGQPPLLPNVRVAFSPDGTRLASGALKPSVKIWDTGNWKNLFSLEGHGDHVVCLTFSHDNRYLATGGNDKTIVIWDATTGTKRFDLTGQADRVTCVAFSPDGKRLFSCGSEGSINVWDLQNRVKLLTLHHRGQFVAVSPDGRRLATCNNDSLTVQVWDSELLNREERWKRHQQRIPFWEVQRTLKPKLAIPMRP